MLPPSGPPEPSEPSVLSERSEPRTAQRRSHRDYTSAIYGSVLAASVILGAGSGRTPLALAIILLVSSAIFWVAHVYAETVASVHGGWELGAINKGLRHEWPMVFASIPPAIAALVAGLLFHANDGAAAWAALITTLVELQIWGLAAARAANLHRAALARTVGLNLSIGLLVVVLKLSVPH